MISNNLLKERKCKIKMYGVLGEPGMRMLYNTELCFMESGEKFKL